MGEEKFYQSVVAVGLVHRRLFLRPGGDPTPSPISLFYDLLGSQVV